MPVKKICFISPNYPTNQDPMYTFLGNLVKSFADFGFDCTVIAPQSLTNFIFKQYRRRPFCWEDITKKGVKIRIFQPIHLPFLNFRIFGQHLGANSTTRAVKKTFVKNNINADLLYAHFWHSGIIAAEISEKSKMPVVVATGESKIWVHKLYSENRIKKALKSINGLISVSTKNLDESRVKGLIKDFDTIVLPNAIDSSLFYKKDKYKMRVKLGIKKKDFVVVFTGAFTERKGVKRLETALQELEDIKAIYLGAGEFTPKGENVLFAGKVGYDEVANYLSAADVFVLPTLAEGCSNAIVEAMACGLPIISSDLEFNYDILDETNSILVDPTNVIEIKRAIEKLKNSPEELTAMGLASIRKSQDFLIENRVKKIINFLSGTCRWYSEEDF